MQQIHPHYQQHQQDHHYNAQMVEPPPQQPQEFVYNETWFDHEVNKVLQQLRQNYNQKIAVGTRPYPLNCNRAMMQIPPSRTEELINLK